MNILVTGASGFIGKNLVSKLLAEKHNVRVFLRHKTNLWNKIPVEEIIGNYENFNDLIKATKGVSIVYHLAAIRDKWGSSWQQYQKTNVEFTNNILKACASNNIKQFIYCSSISVITPPFDKKYYALSKRQAENLVKNFCRHNKINFTIVRPVITYGPGDNGMVYKLIDMIEHNKYFTVGNGENHVHFCYIDDLISGFLLVLNNKKAFEHTYCFCSGKPVKINKLVSIINQAFNKKNNNIHIPLQFAKSCAYILENIYQFLKLQNEPIITINKINTMTVDRSFDYNIAKIDLRYQPKYNYSKGIAKTIKWYKGKNDE